MSRRITLVSGVQKHIWLRRLAPGKPNYWYVYIPSLNAHYYAKTLHVEGAITFVEPDDTAPVRGYCKTTGTVTLKPVAGAGGVLIRPLEEDETL